MSSSVVLVVVSFSVAAGVVAWVTAPFFRSRPNPVSATSGDVEADPSSEEAAILENLSVLEWERRVGHTDDTEVREAKAAAARTLFAGGASTGPGTTGDR